MLRAMSRRGLGLGLVLSSALLAQGCSLIFVSGPPDGYERLRYFDCVSNGGALAGDASWALFDGLVAAGLASADGEVNDDGEKLETGGAAALFGVAAAIHAGSLIYGVIKTDRCSSAKAHLQQRMAEQDAATQARIEELELQLSAPVAPTAVPAAPAPGSGQVLELVPQPVTPPAGTAVPPPPDAYTQPPPAQPAPPPAQPAAPSTSTTPAKP